MDIDDYKSNELVRYSRAGDAFHYRWAARRCLKMLYPSSDITLTVVEGSKENAASGEYVIDIAEYHDTETGEIINYYQLKHTTVQKDKPFRLSDLKNTIEGFAKRYRDPIFEDSKKSPYFYIVTNRSFSNEFVKGLESVRTQSVEPGRFYNTITNYTKLDGAELFDFCARLKLVDNEGDFQEQRNKLLLETASLIAGDFGSTSIDALTEFIADKARPHSDGRILPEEILLRFGCTSKQSLFPAEPKLENIKNPIIRKQYWDIAKAISKTADPVIVHASGGVGKSILAMTLSSLLPEESIVITYDCFGMGEYRNHSKPRHRFRDCLVQIANELAVDDWCTPLIAEPSALEDQILSKFLDRLDIAIKRIRKLSKYGDLYIVVDAADNAELAAKENNQICFAHALLREKMPENCHLVMLCRTERVELLNPVSSVKRIELLPFNEEESLNNLKRYFSDASIEDGLEFHRLTGGNPRVQANALESGCENVQGLLSWLGPDGSTVETQLEKIFQRIIDNETDENKQRITEICFGLAILPPFVPINVLASATGVKRSDVTSFIADFGKAIWLTDSYIQFRDEPTETWFRNNFISNKDRAENYITKLKPLAEENVYVAQVLPILLLQGQYFDELIELALSDRYLPEINAVEKRNVRIFRLKFAFKAALQQGRYCDVAKLAMLAGEETAGNSRQLEVFKKNIDLVGKLLDIENLQQLAYSKQLKALWDGSENIYTSLLLSDIDECVGEARAFLRSAERWLFLYLEERNKNEINERFTDKLTDDEILELTWAHYNLEGIEGAIRFIINWRPDELIFRISSRLVSRLIDYGQFSEIEKSQLLAKDNIYLVLGINNELSKVGKFASKSSITSILKLLNDGVVKLPEITDYQYRDDMVGPVLSFFEACIFYNINTEDISKLVKMVLPERAPTTFESYYRNEPRQAFMRTAALRVFLNISDYKNEKEWLPGYLLSNKIDNANKVSECKSMLFGLLPWYFARLSVISDKYDSLSRIIDTTKKKTKGILKSRYKDYDVLLFEISYVYASILIFISRDIPDEVHELFYFDILESNSVWLDAKLLLLRGANRNDQLSCIRDELEKSICSLIEKSSDETEIIADNYISLARALYTFSSADSSEYLNKGILILSRFGDELPSRWNAINSLAEKCSTKFCSEDELAYRFIRCVEFVGDNIVKQDYLNREAAVKTCTKLSAGVGLSSVSRWRDREVGHFEDLFPKVVTTCVELGYLKPEEAWPLSAFIHNSEMTDLAFACIQNDTTKSIKELIVEDLLKYSGMLDFRINKWEDIKEYLINSNAIKSETIDLGNKLYSELTRNTTDSLSSIKPDLGYRDSNQPEMTDDIIHYIFDGLNVLEVKDILELFKRFNSISDHYKYHDQFLTLLISEVNIGDVAEFIRALVKVDSLDFYDLRRIFTKIPQSWRYRPSFQTAWIKAIGKASELRACEIIGWYNYKKYYCNAEFNETEIMAIVNGAISGLSKQSNIDDSRGYFEFVLMIHDFLSAEESKSVLEFSLSRMETHIDDTFGDGKWNKWLEPYNEPEKNVAALIWSFLGAPKAEVRWDAVHAVKRIARLNGERLLKQIWSFVNNDLIGCFGSKDFPFYSLSAHLYLLFALYRIATDEPKQVVPLVDNLIAYAYWNIPHALIQRIAINIIRRIQLCFPDIIDETKLKKLYAAGETQFPIKIISSNEYYSSKENDGTDTGKFFHGYDFERYWFNPLARIFGVSENFIARSASEVIADDWKINNSGGYKEEPRASLFTSRQHDDYYYSHGSRPKLESYQFYLSFHAMFVVAARLLRNKPLVLREDDDISDPWLDWISSYELTRSDGYLLADSRGCVPTETPAWMDSEKGENWRTDIVQMDFKKSVITNDCRLCVDGLWENWQEPYSEEIWVASALVSRESSNALMLALMDYKDSHDYKLPDYGETEWQQDHAPFILRGWIKSEYSKEGLDDYDFWAGGICYPTPEPGGDFIDCLGLEANTLNTQWLDSKKEIGIESINWSRVVRNYNNIENRTGRKLLITLEVAKLLCQKTEMNLIIEVQINRSIKKNYYHDIKEDHEYRVPSHMIYLFTEEGVLINGDGNVNFGKKVD